MPDSTPERWHIDAGPADIAVLDVPPALARTRRFDIDVAFVVRRPAEATSAWHELAVELDGRRQWTRRIDTSNPGQTDGLDYHVRIDVPAGAPLRVRALTRVSGAARVRLQIEAVEG